MDSYKTQILDLESKSSQRSQEIDTLNFELDQSRTKLRIALAEREKDAEALELYQERVRELELNSTTRTGRVRSPMSNGTGAIETPSILQSPTLPSSGSGTLSSELLGATNDDTLSTTGIDDHREQGLGGELDDAISGTTMTDLKLQVRKLTRELESVRKQEADASKILVLENLLEDANRMKARYESDYLAAHREKLVLQRDLEEIRSGKSMGDG
jgi:protein HOOK3